MNVFRHHIYEYKKGLRNLILHTAKAENRSKIEKRLKECQIPYLIYSVSEKKINVFFGNQRCIDVIHQINKKDLKDYTAEEDFILGIMLGYDRVDQCKRYLQMKRKLKAV